MKTIEEFAREMSQAFTEGGPRNDGSKFRVLKDGHPEWMTEVAHEAHGDMLPDDWRYEFIEAACDAIADNDGDLDEARDSLEADIYTHDLTGWLHSRADRHGYCDEAAEEYGWELNRDNNMIALIQIGQLREKQETFDLVAKALGDLVDAQDDDDSDDLNSSI